MKALYLISAMNLAISALALLAAFMAMSDANFANSSCRTENELTEASLTSVMDRHSTYIDSLRTSISDLEEHVTSSSMLAAFGGTTYFGGAISCDGSAYTKGTQGHMAYRALTASGYCSPKSEKSNNAP